MKIKVKLLSAKAKIPLHGSPHAAGYDLSAAQAYSIPPGQTALIKTGIATEIPRGYFGLVCPRGSLALKLQLDMPHSVGIIDSDYRGEWLVPLRNLSAKKTARIPAGERIAQVIFIKHAVAQFVPVSRLSATKRGAGRLGTTGKY